MQQHVRQEAVAFSVVPDVVGNEQVTLQEISVVEADQRKNDRNSYYDVSYSRKLPGNVHLLLSLD